MTWHFKINWLWRNHEPENLDVSSITQLWSAEHVIAVAASFGEENAEHNATFQVLTKEHFQDQPGLDGFQIL